MVRCAALVCVFLASVANGQMPEKAASALQKSVTLIPPYPQVYTGAPTDKLSVQYAVMLVAKQAGIPYNWDQSYRKTFPVCRQWVTPRFTDAPCGRALSNILTPVGLTYSLNDQKLVLLRKPDELQQALNRTVTLSTLSREATDAKRRVTVAEAVAEALKQADIAYNADLSARNVGSIGRQPAVADVRPVSCGEALRNILSPLALTYVFQNGQIVLKRRSDFIAEAMAKGVTLCAPYPEADKGSPVQKIPVEHAVADVLNQAGLEYDWEESFRNAGSTCRQWITPDIRNVPLEEALKQILDPIGMSYTFGGDRIVLRKEGVAEGDEGEQGQTRDALQAPVTLTPPYAPPYKGAPTDRITVQYAVIGLLKQAGLNYNWDSSSRNAGSVCREWVTPDVQNVPCSQALRQILEPLGLTYRVTGVEVVLMKAQASATDVDAALRVPVTLMAPYPESYDGAGTQSMAVQYAVIELLRQVGLGYNWDVSYKNTSPHCRILVQPDIRSASCAAALDAILGPLGLTYAFLDGQLVLMKKRGYADEALNDRVRLVSPYPTLLARPPAKELSVYDAVTLLLRQVGVRLNWNKSRELTEPLCYRTVKPHIPGSPCKEALKRVLHDARLTYAVVDDEVVLIKE